MGLSNHRDTPSGVLSLGEAQRAAVARALVNGPKLVLADEPTGSLASHSAKLILSLLTDLTRHSALLFVTHDPQIATHAHGTLQMLDGHLR